MGRINHALIMAAGRGQRMMPLTEDKPKAMAPYRGTTLIARGIEQIRQQIEHVHITVGYKGALLAEHVIHNDVSSVLNTEGHPNSWWIHNTLLTHLDEPIFVLTCDNVMELEFDLLASDYLDSGSPACMLVPVKPVPGLDGDYIFHRNNVVTALDRHKVADVYCSGIQVINPAQVARRTQAGGDFYGVWNQLIAQEQVMMSRIYPTRWISIDTVDQLMRASS
jgi:NDP-sugar pyrophosphorylase family protein